MGFKEQLAKIADNWLLIVLFVFGIFIVFFLVGSGGMRSYGASNMLAMDSSYSRGYSESYGGGYYPGSGNNLMPEIVNRIIVKTASMNVEVKDWEKSESDLKSYIKSNDAIVTNENVNTQYSKYRNGYYTINVPTDKYDSLVTQLKNIGIVQSFNENANDITGSYVKLQDIIAAEKDRLNSYEKLYNSSNNVDEKIKLMDRIYNQKNVIRGLEYQLQNQNERIDYSQISFTMQEKRPTHANIVFATFGDLWSSFKQSFNVMLYLIAYLLPFVLLWLLIWVIIKIAKRT
ncbi:MAG: DUF4349 domain-containing protein [Candidatus Woesearchaeota archaeon]